MKKPCRLPFVPEKEYLSRKEKENAIDKQRISEETEAHEEAIPEEEVDYSDPNKNLKVVVNNVVAKFELGQEIMISDLQELKANVDRCFLGRCRLYLKKTEHYGKHLQKWTCGFLR